MRWLALFLATGLVVVACGSNPPNRLIVVHVDAGADGAADAGPDGSQGGVDALGTPCVDDAQCQDGIACTYDSCDTSRGRCRNVPDDTQCDDHVYCNGKELCVPGHGCEAGAVVSCDNGDPCTIASCVEATKACAYVPRDVDQDGDPDAHCVPNRDCNDLDPNVSSLHAEVCGNGVDDNCNGQIDEQPCVAPKGTTCAAPIAISGAGSLSVSSVGANKTFTTTCSVTNPPGGQDVVVAVTVPPGPSVDLEIWATASTGEVSLAIDQMCGLPTTELACGTSQASARARARNVAPGTYFAVVTTQMPTTVDLDIGLLAPVPKATNVDCPTAAPIQPGVPTTVAIIDPPKNLPSSCVAGTGGLTYTFTLASAQDIKVYSTTLRGGAPVLGLRDAACVAAVDELSCHLGSQTPLYARAQPAGRYVVTVAASSPADMTVEVDLSPPTATPVDQTCAAPPALAANQRVSFDLTSHTDAVKDGCDPGSPNAAYDLSLMSASDLLLVGRFASSDTGAVALDGPSCAPQSQIACELAPGPTSIPLRVGRRNVPAGDYRTVVTSQLGLPGTLDALVRPTVAPNIVAPGAAETCAQAIDASAGGFFTGDTSTARADYSNGCDAPGGSPGGAPDQVLVLNLAKPQRVVLDMEGSSYETILDVYKGPSCPGIPVSGGCYVGFSAGRSFLDLELDAGQYWVIIDGYNSSKGAWNLDVRVLPP